MRSSDGKSRWLCRKSAGMCVRCECAEKLPRPHHTVVLRRTGKGVPVTLQGTLLHVVQHLLVVFRQIVEIVDQVDQQEFLGQGFWEGWLLTKPELPTAQREVSVSLVVIDNGLVVELRRSDTQAIVGIGGGDE